MQTKLIRITTALVLLVFLTSGLGADDKLTAVFQKHCTNCHGENDDVEGEVDLLAIKTDSALQKHPELLETLIEVLDERRMPPEDQPQLTEDLRNSMLATLREMSEQTAKSLPFKPIPLRRMNRFQFNNAVVDLLELDRDIFQLNERFLRRREDYFRPETGKMPDQVRVSCRPLSKDIDNQRPEGFRGVAPFPQDQRAEHGFDNRADHLTLSPLLMESFLQLSQSISHSPDLNPNECRSWDWLFAPPGQPVRGVVDGRYEAERTHLVKVVNRPQGNPRRQGVEPHLPKWSGDAQLFWMCPNKDNELQIEMELDEPAKGLRFEFTVASDYGTFDIYVDEKKVVEAVDLYDPKLGLKKSEATDLDLQPGKHRIGFKCVGKHEKSSRHFFGVDYIEVIGGAGEGGAASEKELVKPNEDEAIRERVQRLLRRAFRRPADNETIDRFVEYTKAKRASGASLEEAIRSVVGAVLGTPDFLYIYENTGEDTDEAANKRTGEEATTPGRTRVSDFELATRLSQFFWSSIPDDTLLDLAEAGTLSKPKTLAAQIDRMLNDRRSGRFCDNFPCQWLQLDRLVTAIPDEEKFAYFYYDGYRSSMHMMSEPLLLFETVFVEDRSVMELIDPKFTWQSNMLKANYEGNGQAGTEVQVQTFRRVPLEDPRRGGVITNAAIMTMTSTPVRTQPITRGAWVNTVIFNDPPEPPPADVPPLNETDAEELAKLTIRERLALHRERADCAGCHNQIDPLGFALENYGPTGVWRDKYDNGREVDVSGVLFNQHDFKTATEFKQLIINEKHRFIRAFASHLLSYALGRELGPADSPALDKITKQAVAGNDSFRTILKSIATSEPMLHKNVTR